jgi:hypothetical protein
LIQVSVTFISVITELYSASAGSSLAVEKTRTAELFEPPHPFDDNPFAQSAPPVFDGDTHQHCDRTAGVIIVVDGAKGGDASIGRSDDDIRWKNSAYWKYNFDLTEKTCRPRFF